MKRATWGREGEAGGRGIRDVELHAGKGTAAKTDNNAAIYSHNPHPVIKVHGYKMTRSHLVK